MAFQMFPGPANTELLFLCQEHRARMVYYNKNSTPLEVRRSDKTFFDHYTQNSIPSRVMEYIRLAGFGGVLDCGYHKIDHALVTALVERWRPETHTFHLPVGEVSITLQDVQVLWGLNVEGNVVTGMEDMNFDTLRELCENFLGFSPTRSDVKGSMLKIARLVNCLNNELPDDANDIQIQQRARLYIMIIIGGIVFPDNSGSRVPIFYLFNIMDLESCHSLSWGSACLAHLYRCLCRATNPHAVDVTGPLMLLQFWAWERFSAFRPEVVRRNYNYATVYAARWARPHSYINIATHVLKAARSALASVSDNNGFAWTPYDNVLANLPEICTSGMVTWQCDTFMVCWEIVEPHLPSRVMRQFSLYQTIPTNLLMPHDLHKALHLMTKKGKKCNWQGRHEIYIQHWYSRHQHYVHGEPAQTFRGSVEYMNWYWPRTVVHIVSLEEAENTGFPDTAPSREVLMEGLTYLSQQLPNRLPGDELSQVPQRYMDAANMSHRMSIDAVYFSEHHGSFPPPPPPQVETLRRSRNRRGRQMGGVHSAQFDEPSTSFRPQGPSTHEFGGPSTQTEPREFVFDLNAVPTFTPMVSEPFFGTECYTPILPQEPTRDMYGGPSRSNMSPVSMDFSSDWSWPDILNMTNESAQNLTPGVEPANSIPVQDEAGSWWLARDRDRRVPIPRGPCMTSERHNQYQPDHPGQS